jgi:hypothetical protein
MAYVKIETGSFLVERKKLQELNSRLLLSSVDFIEASLWLIAGNRLPQALVMLHNAIEVALKGELERIHKILIANTKELSDFRALKSLLRDAFMNHPSGSGVEIPEFDIEKTIYFEEAFDRVAELYPGLSERWRQQLISAKGRRNKESLHSLRNDIVHYGGDKDSTGRYAEAIITIGFPFCEEFLRLVSRNEVCLANLVKEWVYREVEVARLVFHDLRNANAPPYPYGIKILQHHMMWTHAGWPSPRDDLDTVTLDGSKTEWEEYVERQKRELFSTWDEGRTVEISCPVCDSDTGDGSNVMAQVLLENAPLDKNRLVPEGFNCFVCGLLISPEERFLAQHFVGQIPEDVATAYLTDIGQL